MTQRSRLTIALVVSLALSAIPIVAVADDADSAYQNIGETYGLVPGFFSQFPRDQLANLWGAFSAHQMNPDLDMDGGTRELIGIAIAAHGPCQACLYFHVAAALANGASEDDILAAVNVAQATARLHAGMSESVLEPMDFRQATDLVLWGDAPTVAARSPSAEFCQRLVAAKGELAGFCSE
jgi:AhpD family alkylhydroperoxidase